MARRRSSSWLSWVSAKYEQTAAKVKPISATAQATVRTPPVPASVTQAMKSH